MITTYAAAPLSAATLHERVDLDRRARQFVAMLAMNLLVVSPHDRARVLGGYPVEPEHDRGGAMAWCSANGIGEDLTWLRGWLVRWKVDNAAIRAEWWSEVSADEVRDALARESWAGVLQMVRR